MDVQLAIVVIDLLDYECSIIMDHLDFHFFSFMPTATIQGKFNVIILSYLLSFVAQLIVEVELVVLKYVVEGLLLVKSVQKPPYLIHFRYFVGFQTDQNY